VLTITFVAHKSPLDVGTMMPQSSKCFGSTCAQLCDLRKPFLLIGYDLLRERLAYADGVVLGVHVLLWIASVTK
jgi:hypothetical protein